MSINLELEKVNLFYDEAHILKNITCKFEEGKTTIITGHSGSGKTSLLKVAAGIIPIEDGRIIFNGQDINKMEDTELLEFRRKSGFVFQDSALWANKNVHQNLSLPLQFHYRNITDLEINDTINEFIRPIGYENNINLRPAQLSVGENKVISFLRGIIGDPDLIFLDSPFSQIDPRASKYVLDKIKSFKKKNKTIIMVLTYLNYISDLADYIMIIKNGEISNYGLTKDIFSLLDEKEPDPIAIKKETGDEI